MKKGIPPTFELNRITRAVEEAKHQGRSLVDLTVSNPTLVNLDYPVSEIEKALRSGDLLPYEPDARGLRSAREAISKHVGRMNPDQMWLTASTSEAYSYLFKLLAESGEGILVPTPSYPLFDHLLKLENLRPAYYPIHYGEGWFVDLDELRAAISADTRAIILVHPNNPTGNYWSVDERNALLAICAERNLALISDEVFFDYSLDDSIRPTSFAGLGQEVSIFTLGGLSKLFGLPQLKLSWIHLEASPKYVKELSPRLDWISDLYLSVATPLQRAMPQLLDAASPMTERIRERVRENLRGLRKIFGPCVLRVEGGWTAILEFESGLNEEEFVLELLEKENVLVQPGFYFDLPQKAALVISLLPEPGHFQRAIEKIKWAQSR